MGTIRVDAEREIGAPTATVYGYLADMTEHQRFLPAAFTDFTVVEGGTGAGTVTTFNVNAGGRTRAYRMVVDEPSPGVLTESDENSSLVTTFTVAASPGGSLVTISTTWNGAGGIGGFFERRFAPRAMRSIYDEQLGLLANFAADRAADDAKVDEADDESFPASDPPAF